MLLATALPAVAHDSPEHVIHDLSHRIEADGATARLLTARAFEHQAMRNWSAAIADFNAALELQPNHGPAILGCAQTLIHQGALTEAAAVARRGLALNGDAARQAPYHALLAGISARRHEWPEALEAWREALKSPHPEVDWFLGEAECLARLSRFTEQSDALAQAMTRNPSVVLRRTWIRALVDAGELDAASHEIERSSAEARWKSAWLLLSARVCALREDYAGQHAASSAALTEIRSRLNPERPDPQLILESALALAFLGRQEEALASMKQARELGVPEASFRAPELVAIGPPPAGHP
ncbi:MAG TPA: tetratricopeptide repeat protein [Opitutaceae bacterium]